MHEHIDTRTQFHDTVRIMLNPLAQELNATLEGTTPGALLSQLGRRMFFPRGIISQGAEAKQHGKVANATIGMTICGGSPAALPSVHKFAPDLSPGELVAYMPTAGSPQLRERWRQELLRKNPSLAGKSFSLPVLVPGLTAGISYLSDLFLEEGRALIAGNPSWDNYSLIVSTRTNAELRQFQMFADGKFNMAGLEAIVREEAKTGFVRLIVNIPQNPSGYSPTKSEAQEMLRIVRQAAEGGARVMVWCDDAYFGLNYEDDIEPQSLFAYLADMHPNVLAVKIDGPTKEDFVWGFRCGFLTFGGKSLSDAHYDALVKKLMGAIRSSVSCSSTPSQSILLRALDEPGIESEKNAMRDMLEARYRAVKDFVLTHTNKTLSPLPFNSGYFMSFDVHGADAETLRQKLLHEDGIGTIALDSHTLRVAFSSIDEEKIPAVYAAIYKKADSLA